MGKRQTKRLTVKRIESLKPRAKPYEVPDGLGLFLTMRPTGAASFNLRYRFEGRSRNLTIASAAIGLATARELAREALVEIARGNDPGAIKKERAAASEAAKRDTVAAAVEAFLAAPKPKAKAKAKQWKPSWAKEAERLLRVEVVAKWGNRRLADITDDDVKRLVQAIAKRAPTTGNRVLAILRGLCNWAVKEQLIATSPAQGVDKPSAEKSRERALDDRELALVWKASEALGWPFAALIQLLILTGQRRGEVAGMRWREVDFDKAQWRIPSERSKNHLVHVVPLAPQAVDILRTLPRFGGSDFLFSSGATPPSGFSLAKRRLDREIVKQLVGADAIEPFTVHDIRRSVASGLARLGVPLEVTEKILNHTSGSFAGVAGVYNRHDYEGEMRTALTAWATAYRVARRRPGAFR